MIYNKLLEVLIAVGLIVAAWFYAGHRAVSEYKQEMVIEQAFATAEQQAKYNKLAEEYELLRTKRQENARTITKEVERIIEKPSYDGDCMDSDGLRWANEAIRGGDIGGPATTVQADSGTAEHK